MAAKKNHDKVTGGSVFASDAKAPAIVTNFPSRLCAKNLLGKTNIQTKGSMEAIHRLQIK